MQVFRSRAREMIRRLVNAWHPLMDEDEEVSLWATVEQIALLLTVSFIEDEETLRYAIEKGMEAIEGAPLDDEVKKEKLSIFKELLGVIS